MKDGNLLSDGRSKYEWNSQGRLTKVTFPDGFGEAYAYDSLGRRKSKTQFNHRGETQEVTNYHYKGDSWMVVKETDESGNENLSFGFNEGGKPLSVTYQGETFWYVYNGHGDVVALTDKDGNVAARYEYDAWGLVTKMYNRFGERVREGIGYIGDLGTGNGSPGSLQGPVDENGNILPDYNPDNNSDPQNGNGGSLTTDVTLTDSTATLTDTTTSTSTAGETTTTVEQEPTEDITTELVKLNPYRYAGYYWDRKTQYYYLQARYYDPRNGRFLSADTYRGEIDSPLTLNLYTYVQNNSINFVDPTGHFAFLIPVIAAAIEAAAPYVLGAAAVGAGIGVGKAISNSDTKAPVETKSIPIPYIKVDELEKTRENKNIVYRALNSQDVATMASAGIVAKNPKGPWSPRDHVLKGSSIDSWTNDPWISTTTDFSVAVGFDSGYGIVAIDLNKVPSKKVYQWTKYDINSKDVDERIAYQYSVWQREVSIYQLIPRGAIIGYVKY